MSEIQILRLYRCRISFEADGEAVWKIENNAFKWEGSMTVKSFLGNPACHPYIEAESSSMEEISAWRGKMLRYIKRFKSARLI